VNNNARPHDQGVLKLALPLIFSFWLRAAFQWVDTIYASSLDSLGDASIAAIGLTAPFEFLMIACWVGTSSGLTSRLAAAMGAGEGRKIEQLKVATRRIVGHLRIVFLLLAVGLWFGADHLVADKDVAQQFKLYGPVLLAGSGITAFWSVLPDSIVKAHNDMRSTMWAGVISTLTNFALNTVFVFVFHWGILGIGLATVLARLSGLAYALGRARMHEDRRLALAEDNKPGLFEKPTKAILQLSVPAGLSFGLLALEGIAINYMLTKQTDSSALLAAWSIVDRAGRFLTMPVVAIGVALLPLCARLWGARDLQRIQRELRTGLKLCVGYSLLFAMPLTILLGPFVSRALTDAPEAQEAAKHGLRLISLAVLFGGPMFMLRSTFDGMQMPRPGFVVSSLRTIVFVLPLATLGMHFAPNFGLAQVEGLVLGVSLATGMATILLLLWMRAFLREELSEEAQ
jgi:Na+-driven multidrug efflux pump